MAPTYAARAQIAKDTIDRAPSITSSTPGATSDSQFITSQLPTLSRTSSKLVFTNHPSSKISVVNQDAFSAARELLNEFGQTSKVGILNLASAELEGGGWLQSLATTQEEALCYSSTLYSTILRDPSLYPWPNATSGIFSPAVVVFKHDLDHDCVDLEEDERRIVSVISVAAPMGPELARIKVKVEGKDEEEWRKMFKNKKDLNNLREKIRLVYRMAGWNGVEFLILGAMGCGAYHCPPHQVAEEMKAILLEEEFKGWFRKVVFAVYSTARNGAGNFQIFKDAFEGVDL